MCLKSTIMKDEWFLDSGCLRHMTRDLKNFSSIKAINEGFVTLADNTQCKILNVGKISKGFSSIDNVSLVNGFKHNLLSVS